MLLLLLAVAGTSVAQTHVALTSPEGTNFWLYTPASYSTGTPAPMLVSLHGIGQIGTDINTLVNQPLDATPAYLIARSQWQASRPFIVVSPQLKPDGTGTEQDWSASVIDEVIEYVKTLKTIDPNRIYLTGLSLGGQGCMIYGIAHPDKVAAMIAISGRTNEILDQACTLVNIPIWMFHGRSDGTVAASNSIDMYDAINSCTNPGTLRPHLTLLDGIRHTTPEPIWNTIYDLRNGYLIYDWLIQFTKNDATNKAPYVNAGADKKFLAQDSPIYIYGNYFDSDGTITNVLWTKFSGPSVTLENTNDNILKIINPAAGTYILELTVTDNLGIQKSDQIQIIVYNTLPAGNTPLITGFRLMNGTTNSEIGTLVNEQIINKNVLGVDDYNVRAITQNTNSFQFRVNSNQNTRVGSAFNPANVLLTNQPVGASTEKEWQIPVGDHVICTTPYPASNATGTDGITKCIKISVFDQPIVQYYPKPGEDLSMLSSWGANTDGTGSAPVSFTGNFQEFIVNSLAPQNGSWTVGGIQSFLYVRGGGELTINNTFNGVINVEGNGIVNINTNQPVMFGSVSPTSTIRFGTNATTIPAINYGNVVIQAGNTKLLPAGTITLAGNLTIENDAILQGAADNTSVISLAGNLTLLEESIFAPGTKFSLTLSGTSPQTLTLSGTKVSFNQVTVANNTTVISGAVPVTLEVGSSTGGGLIVENGKELLLNKNHLNIVGTGTINSLNQTGEIGFQQSRLSIQTTSTSTSFLHPKIGKDTVSVLLSDVTSSSLSLQGTLYVSDSVKTQNGTLLTNGYLALVSTSFKTARIARKEGTGSISGNVQFQRYLEKGRQYRYLSFPVRGVTVSNLQDFIPVTGTFTGASTGAGLSNNPSLFTYQEPAGWLAFPVASNTEEFSIGTGYSAFVRDSVTDTKLVVSGPIHEGDFVYDLQPGTADDMVGWNLLGNPYAAPIQWGDWPATGIGSSVYVRDNTVGAERFLLWDGDTGDEEFAGNIAQGQSFWVKAIAADPTLTLQETSKRSDQATLYRTQDQSGVIALTTTLQRGNLLDRAYLKFNDKSGLEFDARYDALKKKNGYFNLSVLSSDSVSLAIKNLPEASCLTTASLSIEDASPGSYSLTFSGTYFDQSEKEIFLSDTFLDSLLRIQQNDTYGFTISDDSESYGNKRFELKFITPGAQPLISVQGNELLSNVVTGNQWLLNGEEIDGATMQTYTPLVSGAYQVRTGQEACVATSPTILFIVTGIEPASGINVFPNPTRGQITIKGITTPTRYTVHTLLGVELQRGTILSDTQIDLNAKAGVYLLTLENDFIPQHIRLIVQ
ncbi:MAG: dienelactone hydrolase family protein [Cyclobacteriaceae bacterium]|nr:dienelactone hydrolase family protein [Cyclobacteriaceae bacterium]